MINLDDEYKQGLKFWGTLFILLFCFVLFFDSCFNRCSFEKTKDENIELKKQIEVSEKEVQIDSIDNAIESYSDSIKKIEDNEDIMLVPNVDLDSLERWIQPRK